MEPEVPPAGIDGGVHRSLETLFLHPVGHVGAVPGHLPPDDRVGPGADGLGVGRQVDAGGVGPHLVVVDEPLGDPVAEQQRGYVARLDRVLHEGVAVVVVPDVVVVEPRLLRSFVFRTHPAVVPLVHQVHSVRIHRGDQDRDGVIENLVDPGIVTGGETPDDFRRRLARRHLVRVECVTLEEDHLAAGDRGVDLILGMPARILEHRVHPLVVVEPREVLRGGDIQHEKRAAERRRADVLDPDPVALRADEFVVLDELVPLGELAVGAHAVAEELLGGGDLGGGLGRKAAKDDGADEGEDAKDAGGGTGSHGGNGRKRVRMSRAEPAGSTGGQEYRRGARSCRLRPVMEAAETVWNADLRSGTAARHAYRHPRGWRRRLGTPTSGRQAAEGREKHGGADSPGVIPSGNGAMRPQRSRAWPPDRRRAAPSTRVSRSRAMPTGGRRFKPAAPSRLLADPRNCAFTATGGAPATRPRSSGPRRRAPAPRSAAPSVAPRGH